MRREIDRLVRRKVGSFSALRWSWEGSTYCIEVDLAGVPIYPGGRAGSERSTTFTLSPPAGAAWDPTNDWSRQGMATNFTYEPVDYTGLLPYIALYDGDAVLAELEPGTGGDPLPTPGIQVGGIELRAVSQGSRLYATGTVKVVDDDGDAVLGASVTVEWLGPALATQTATIEGEGIARFASPKTRSSGAVTLTVTTIAAGGYEYQPEDNTLSI